MTAQHSRCGHYILQLWFLLFSPHLFSAVTDWMSTILIKQVITLTVIWHRTRTVQSYSPGCANVHPIYGKTKTVATAMSLSCTVSAISAFCWPTTQTPSITNCLVAIIHTKPVIAILVPKLVAMATTHRHSISAMSSSDSLTPKPTPRIKQCVASYHTTKIIAHQRPKIGCHGNVP